MNNDYIIYLDMDGVMNNFSANCEKTRLRKDKITNHHNLGKEFLGLIEEINEENLLNLNLLISFLESRGFHNKIVITSSWNNFLNINNFKELFIAIGFNGNVVSQIHGDARAELVYKHIKRNNIQNYIVLDDDKYNYCELIENQRFINTDYNEGFNKDDLSKAKEIIYKDSIKKETI